jgi:hypothetical protein
LCCSHPSVPGRPSILLGPLSPSPPPFLPNQSASPCPTCPNQLGSPPSLYTATDHPSSSILAHYAPLPSLYHSRSSKTWASTCTAKENRFHDRVLWACGEPCHSLWPPLLLLLLVLKSPPSYLPNCALISCQERWRPPALPRPVDPDADMPDDPGNQPPVQDHRRDLRDLRIRPATSRSARSRPRWALETSLRRLGFPRGEPGSGGDDDLEPLIRF